MPRLCDELKTSLTFSLLDLPKFRCPVITATRKKKQLVGDRIAILHKGNFHLSETPNRTFVTMVARTRARLFLIIIIIIIIHRVYFDDTVRESKRY